MLNRAQLIGHVGKDPECGATQAGKRYARFSLATSERWTDKATNEARERTDWHNVVIWGDALVGVIEKFVRKGQQLLVEGRIVTEEYTDKDNIKRWATKIVVQGFEGRVTMLGKAQGGASETRHVGEEPQGRGSGYGSGQSSGYANGNGAGRNLDPEIPF